MNNGVFLSYYDSPETILSHFFFIRGENDEENQFLDCYPGGDIVGCHCYDIFSSHKYARRK